MSISYNDFKKKDVIDVSTGKNLGKVTDLIFESSGRIIKIIVPGKKSSFLSCENLELNFDCIQKIGDDSILYKHCEKRKIDVCDNICAPNAFEDE